MDKKTLTAIVIAIVVLLGVVGVIALTGSNTDDTASSSSTTSGTTNDATKDTTGDASTKDENNSGSSSDTAPVAATAVKIQNFAFSPATIKVKVGDTVTWTNEDSVAHTVTADDTSVGGPKSELFGQGKSYSFKFTKAGTYAYHCTPHPQMKGTVEVTE
jgi:amicyanin